jgi:hypothetical protein
MTPPGDPPIRVLLLADTHVGFDLPSRPRVAARRRGPDFLANFERALAPARSGTVDLVVHGGDLLFRSRVPARLRGEPLPDAWPALNAAALRAVSPPTMTVTVAWPARRGRAGPAEDVPSPLC